MTIRYIETGKIAEVPDSYGARLIEQGMATPAQQPKQPKRKGEKKNVLGVATLR